MHQPLPKVRLHQLLHSVQQLHLDLQFLALHLSPKGLRFLLHQLHQLLLEYLEYLVLPKFPRVLLDLEGHLVPLRRTHLRVRKDRQHRLGQQYLEHRLFPMGLLHRSHHLDPLYHLVRGFHSDLRYLLGRSIRTDLWGRLYR